jgi:hypothetical protein
MSDTDTATASTQSKDDPSWGEASPWWNHHMAARFNDAWRAAGGIPPGYYYTKSDERRGVAPPPPRPSVEERIGVLEKLAEAEARTMCTAVGMEWVPDFSPLSMRRLVVLEATIDFLDFVRAHEPEVARLVREIRERESGRSR